MVGGVFFLALCGIQHVDRNKEALMETMQFVLILGVAFMIAMFVERSLKRDKERLD